MLFLGPYDLVGLVALARDHDHVARRGVRHGAPDGLGAVVDDGGGVGCVKPGADLGEDPLGVLRARVVVGEDDAVGAALGDAAHERALLAVAVAAAPEDAGERRRRRHHLADRREDVVERVRRVGVVHDGDGAVVGAERFEAARHGRRRLERVEHGVGVVPELGADGVGRREVVRVEVAREAVLPLVSAEAEAEAVGLVRHDLEGNVGGAAVTRGVGAGCPVGHDARRRPLYHRLPGRIVLVDDRHGVGVEHREQRGFRVAVGFDGAVVVEVVVGEVGEDGGGEALAADALLDERVGGDLHRARRAAGVGHLAEEPVERERVRRRVRRLDRLLPDPHVDRADEPGRLAERGEEVVEDERRRRLAVGPGHADEP